jgi:molybdenum cofactor cytidylyltransferase
MASNNQKGIAGIIMAAGASRRMEQPKLLLPWRGKPIIRHVALTALEAGLSPVLAVVGEHSKAIEAALIGLEIPIIQNPDWRDGQSTSVKAGVQALVDMPDDEVTAVVFILGDQPLIPADLVQAIVQTYIRTHAAVIAPLIAGKRANPVLFDRSVFSELLALSGDAGARQIFGLYPPLLVPWDDTSVLLDIDTPADYQQLLSGS